MRKIVKKFLLIISLSTFGLSVYQVLQHWDYEETLVDLNKYLRLNVSQKQLSQEIHNAISNAEFDDARMYIEIAKANHYDVNAKRLTKYITQKDTQLRKVITQATNFTRGFINGKSNNVAGITGSVVADFTVVGDVRDLSHEYDKYEKGEDINEMIVLLSGAGVGLTALTVSSLGAAAPAKAGTSIIKLAVKTRRMTRGFQKHLLKLGRKVFDWSLFSRSLKQNKNISRAAKQAYHPEAIKPLKKIAKQVNRIRKFTSTVDTVHLLKYVDSPNDLRNLEKVSLKYGTKTKGLMKLVGKGALRTVRVLRKTTALILSLLASVLSGLLSLLLLFKK